MPFDLRSLDRPQFKEPLREYFVRTDEATKVASIFFHNIYIRQRTAYGVVPKLMYETYLNISN